MFEGSAADGRSETARCEGAALQRASEGAAIEAIVRPLTDCRQRRTELDETQAGFILSDKCIRLLVDSLSRFMAFAF